MTTIHSLPIELIADIFQQTLTSSARHSRDPRDITRLSHVCSHWREIIHFSPSLWDSLRLVWSEAFSDWSIDQHNRRKCMTQHALSHSRDLPLSLEIHAENIPNNDVVRDIIDSIFPASSRIQHLRLVFSLPDHVSLSFLFPTCQTERSFPLLESLHLRFWTEREGRIKYASNIFSNSPNLRSLTIEQGFTKVSFTEDAFCWQNIQDLAIRAILGCNEYHSVLRRCTNLRSAALTVRVRGSFLAGTEMPCAPPLMHPTLSELSVRVADARGNPFIGDILFDSLTLPALASFSCHKICDPDLYSPLTAFNALVRRSSCPLTNLKLDFDDTCCVAGVRDLVDCTPNLTSLDVTLPGRVAADLFAHFKIVQDRDLNALLSVLPTSWPHLKSLTVDASTDLDPTILLDILDKRATSLDNLYIESKPDANVLSKVEELKALGLNVNFEEKDEFADEFVLNIQ